MSRKKLLFWGAFLLGAAWRVKETRAWLPLRGYQVHAQTPALERRLWEVFPSRCVAFWPWLLRDSDGLREFLERDIPIQAATRMSGFGHFETTLRWLTPWLKVQWRGRLWCVSREGRMWALEAEPLSQQAGTPGVSIKGPVWRVPEDAEPFAQGEDDAPPSGVFKAPLNTDVIAGFVDRYHGFGWYEAATEIVLDRRAGADLFRLKLQRGEQRFDVLIQSAKYTGQDWGAAIDAILSRLVQEGGNHLIDATYEGKILLRNLGPGEGSRK